MKKAVTWITLIAFAVFVVDWGIVGMKLLDGDYGITAGVYVAAVCWLVILVCTVYKAFSNRCPHCKKLLLTNGKYCPHCGREI